MSGRLDGVVFDKVPIPLHVFSTICGPFIAYCISDNKCAGLAAPDVEVLSCEAVFRFIFCRGSICVITWGSPSLGVELPILCAIHDIDRRSTKRVFSKPSLLAVTLWNWTKMFLDRLILFSLQLLWCFRSGYVCCFDIFWRVDWDVIAWLKRCLHAHTSVKIYLVPFLCHLWQYVNMEARRAKLLRRYCI